VQGPAAVQGLQGSAQRKLDETIASLNGLREQVAAERLPLDEKLRGLEERLLQQRRTYDDVARLADVDTLEIANIDKVLKGHRDELTYIADRLDEYARNFESKVDVSELQHCGKVAQTARQAAENTTLSPDEKFARQLGLVDASLKRLGDAVGGMRFDGVGVDPAGNVVDGRFALIGPVALFASPSGAAGLVVPQTGSDRPLIRPLDEPMQQQLRNVVEQGEGTMPVDPSGGAALKALLQKTSLIHVFEKGGPIMWPLLAASVLALGTVLERLLFLANERRKRDARALDALLGLAENGRLSAAIDLGRQSRDFVVRTLVYALQHRERSLSNALLLAQARELKRFRRGIPILDTVITLAPMLGLLGTVTGMMGSFSIIGGDLGSPQAITGGIAEALIATAFGLGIAITALVPFNFLNARLEEAEAEIDAAARQLELLANPHLRGSEGELHVAALPVAVGG
jgi:biopolymer transport protein ExbB